MVKCCLALACAEGYMRISFATRMENPEKMVARIRQVFES